MPASNNHPWLDEQFYKSPPQEKPGKYPAGYDPAAFRLECAAAFERDGREGFAELGETLRSCRPDHRCGSGACPECVQAMDCWLALALAEGEALAKPVARTSFGRRSRPQLEGQITGAKRLLRVSINLTGCGDDAPTVDDLSIDFLHGTVLPDALKGAGLQSTPFVLTLSATFKVESKWDDQVNVEETWIPYWEGFTYGNDPARLEEILKATFAECFSSTFGVSPEVSAFGANVRVKPAPAVKSHANMVTLPHHWHTTRGDGLTPEVRDEMLLIGRRKFLSCLHWLDRIGLRGRIYEQNTCIFDGI